ncbi:MAG: TlyA family RNA methyltransferase [Candidatus Gastranaerophilales bacterium]|nr:TlyA family RNA methyltransferase [Candidatus Gastranaerophilales bacterium]
MAQNKKRLDSILFELKYFDSKSSAAANIIAQNVKINGQLITKAGTLYDENFFNNPEKPVDIEINSIPFVSRGGLKLQGAIEKFGIDLKDKICIDMGASTGGFTDCMLQNGAKFVYALDVGYNQLAWKLKNDKRIKSIEKINVKNCTASDVYGVDKPEEKDLPVFMSMDLSFISIKKVLENCKKLISKNASAVLLIKPQFEAGKDEVEKGGVVKSEKTREKIIKDIEQYCNSIGFITQGIMESPIQGAKSKNTEYLIYLKRGE